MDSSVVFEKKYGCGRCQNFEKVKSYERGTIKEFMKFNILSWSLKKIVMWTRIFWGYINRLPGYEKSMKIAKKNEKNCRKMEGNRKNHQIIISKMRLATPPPFNLPQCHLTKFGFIFLVSRFLPLFPGISLSSRLPILLCTSSENN